MYITIECQSHRKKASAWYINIWYYWVANQRSHRKEIKEADSQIQAAEDMRKEVMDLLQKGIKANDSKKVSAANAILERLD